MSNRLIKTTDKAKIYYDSETGEYVVKPLAWLKDEATWYFTDDKEDAFSTAEVIDGGKRKSNPSGGTLFPERKDAELFAERLNHAWQGSVGYFNAYVSGIGGPGRASVLITVSKDKKENWPNGILENSRYGKFHLSYNGRLEMITKHNMGDFRKTKVSSRDELTDKLDAWYNKPPPEEYGVFDYQRDGKYKKIHAVRVFKNEKAAEKYAAKLNETGGDHVVRLMRHANPVPLAKGTKMKRKKAATKKRKFSPAQLAAQKRFAEMARARAGKTVKRARKKTAAPKKRATRSRLSNPRIRYGYDEIIQQTTQMAKLAGITVHLEKHGGEKPVYQIVSEGGSPMSQMLTALQMRDWLHGAIALALVCKNKR